MAEGHTNGSGTRNDPEFYAGYSRFEIELEVRSPIDFVETQELI